MFPSGAKMVPINWCEMQCPRTHSKEFRKVARVQPEYLQAWDHFPPPGTHSFPLQLPPPSSTRCRRVAFSERPDNVGRVWFFWFVFKMSSSLHIWLCQLENKPSEHILNYVATVVNTLLFELKRVHRRAALSFSRWWQPSWEAPEDAEWPPCWEAQTQEPREESSCLQMQDSLYFLTPYCSRSSRHSKDKAVTVKMRRKLHFMTTAIIKGQYVWNKDLT